MAVAAPSLVGLAGIAYALRLIDRSRLKAINLRLLVGDRFARAEIAPLAESYADKVVARGLHPAALEQIAADRAADTGCCSRPRRSTSMSMRSPSGWGSRMCWRPNSTSPTAAIISTPAWRATIVTATPSSPASTAGWRPMRSRATRRTSAPIRTMCPTTRCCASPTRRWRRLPVTRAQETGAANGLDGGRLAGKRRR